MNHWDSLAQVPDTLTSSVVTMGNFDGVHLGHQHVLREAVTVARERGIPSVALTFDPHPRLVHHPEEPLVPIVSLPQRLELLEQADIDATVVVHYTLDFAAQTPREYVKSTFVDILKAEVVIVGSDCRFGAGNSGDIQTLRELGEEFGFDVVEVSDVGNGHRWSSTWVRKALEQGRVAEAGRILGRPHSVSAEIVHGAARGRELGYPTANLSTEAQGMIPADGVYAGWFYDADGHRWPSAISVGSNPTFEGVERTVEAHVIDRPEDEKIEDFDLYGQFATVEFIARLRGMVAFEGIPRLIEQIGQDVVDARAILEERAPAVDNTDD